MRNNEQGLTLIELLVVLVVSGLVLGGVFSLFKTHNLIAARQEETSLMEQELLTTMVQMADDLRMCGFAPNGGTFGFANLDDKKRFTNSSAIYFTWDKNQNAAVDDNSTETVGYRLNVNTDGSAKSTPDNVLSKYQNDQWYPMASNIGALQFFYQDADGVIITSPASNLTKIRTVQITGTAVPSIIRAGLGIGNRTMTTTVLCRNLNE